MQEMILDSIEEENVYGIVIPEDEIEEDYEPSERGEVFKFHLY